MQKQVTILFLLVALCTTLFGQQDQQLATTSISIKEVPQLQLPTQDNKQLLDDELSRRAPGRAPHFAITMNVDVSPETHGLWEENNGLAIWRLRVPSPAAHSLNFGFDVFVMPAGGQLMLYTPDKNDVQGPFTPADNEEHEELWTPIIEGDEIVIKVSLPIEKRQELQLHLKSVNHDFLGFKSMSGLLSGSCNLDVVCGEEDGWGIVDQYRDIIQSVANMSINGNTFCTGFLVNNVRQDCTPFFMTANHCDNLNENSAPSLVVYWNYVNSFCRQFDSPSNGGNGNGTFNSFNSGSIFRASYGPSDMKLVELDDEVTSSANAFYAGWDARELLPTDTLICVHHPSNNEKRISFQWDGAYRGTWANDDTPVPNGNHLIIEDWDVGTTEGGSSGAPLFNGKKQVIGQLHGGLAACDNSEYDSYGWMAFSWEGGGTSGSSLKAWLDPDDTGLLVLDGRSQSQCNIVVTIDQPTRSICAGELVVFDISTSENFGNIVNMSVDNLPTGLSATFSDNSVIPGESTQLTISGTGNLNTGSYTFMVRGTDGTNTSVKNLTLNVDAGLPAAPTLISPADQAIDQALVVILNWEEVGDRIAYSVELSTDPSFNTIIAQQTGLSENTFISPNLELGTTYYWRVNATNTCGTGSWSTPFQFKTGVLACSISFADTDGINIGPSGGTVTTSTLVIDQDGPISAISLVDFSTNHSYTGDLTARLISPDGISIQLFSLLDCESPGMLVSFDDEATATYTQLNNACNPGSSIAIQGIFQPLEPLSTFLEEEAAGTWTLEITDNFNQDGGELLGWGLDICTLQASLTPSEFMILSCPNETVSLQLTVGAGFEGNVMLSASNLPAGVNAIFETNNVAPGSTVNVDITGLVDLDTYNIEFTAEDGTNLVSSTVSVSVVLAPDAVSLLLPANQAAVMGSNTVDFSWLAVANIEDYTLEIATDDNFNNIVYENTTTSPSLEAELDFGQYYWRVISANDCGESESEFFTFTFEPTATINIAGTSLNIWPNPTNGPLHIALSRELSGNLNISLFAASGQRIIDYQLPAIAGAQILDLGDLPTGIYLLRVTNGQNQAISRLVIE